MATPTKDDGKPLQIINLQAENLKRIKAVNITPKGDMVMITGKNGQGKSSVLDAIWWAIGGMANVQVEPIRKGQEKARIRLDLGEVIITRTFGRNAKKDGELTTNITVESPDGARWPSPQRMLDSMLGVLTFDPLQFSHMKPKDRFDAVKAFVSGIDFDAIDRANLTDYSKRTDANRRVRDLEGQIAAIAIPATVPTEKVDEVALVAEIASAGEFNAQLQRRAEARAKAADEVTFQREAADGHRARAADLRRQAELADADAVKADADAVALQAKLDAAEALPDPKDAAALQTQLADAKKTNAVFDQVAQRDALQMKLNDTQKEADALTAAIAARDDQKKAAIAAAKMPIDGLDFAADDITFGGVPFDQASDAEKLRISMAIAMANNPRLRVIRVRDGSLLDEDSLKVVADMAKDKGYQVWMEKVDSSGKVGFVIEDGSVKTVNDPEPDDKSKGGLL